jgi:hypothetical protein
VITGAESQTRALLRPTAARRDHRGLHLCKLISVHFGKGKNSNHPGGDHSHLTGSLDRAIFRLHRAQVSIRFTESGNVACSAAKGKVT